MKKGETSSQNKLERKTIEKNRRILMKKLSFKLVSLIADHHFTPAKKFLSQQDQIEQAATYIQTLRERIEGLKRRKAQLMSTDATNRGAITSSVPNVGGSNLPILKIEDLGSGVEVVLISGINKKFMLHQVISILEEEGVQVVSVIVSTIGDKIFHTLHAKVKIPRVGADTSRISERICGLIS